MIEDIRRDVLTGVRAIRSTPLVAAAIVGTLGLGLGLIAAVFSIYSALFLDSDHVPRSTELFAIERPTRPGARTWMPFTRLDFDSLHRDTNLVMDSFGSLHGVSVRVHGRAASGTLVTGNFFQTLAVPAALGRTLIPADEVQSPLVVLSHSGWTRLFDADPEILGRSISINGGEFQVIGVMPEGFRGLSVSSPDYWASLGLVGRFRRQQAGKEDSVWIEVAGRLRPGISEPTARATLTTWASQQPRAAWRGGQPVPVNLKPIRGTLDPDRFPVYAVFGPNVVAFGLILLICCANVANLLLVRGLARGHEIVTRVALGASRRRVVQQLSTESVILALAAAAVGFVVSRACLHGGVIAFLSSVPPEISEQLTLALRAPDATVAGFLILAALATTVVFGLWPALRVTRPDVIGHARMTLATTSRIGRSQYLLIGLQTGASTLLLICAAVFLGGVYKAASVDLGVRTTDTLTIPITSEQLRVPLVAQVRDHPVVQMTAATAPSLLDSLSSTEVQSSSTPVRVRASYQFVSAGFFETLDIPILKGRGFAGSERDVHQGVAMVAQPTAERLWPNEDAVGRNITISIADPELGPMPQNVEPLRRTYTVIGVVRKAGETKGLGGLNSADIYLPIALEGSHASLVVRVNTDPTAARQQLLDDLVRTDPALGTVWTLRERVRVQTYVLRLAFWVAATLGAIALLLTLSGLFGLVSYVIQRRAKEIGVRVALGATPRRVVRLVLRESMPPVAVGLSAGAVLAVVLASTIVGSSAGSSIRAVVPVFDPLAYTVGLATVLLSCLLAIAVPAFSTARRPAASVFRQE